MSIVIENLSYVYSPKTPFEHKALDNISLTVEDGDFLGIIGATGSGKSTFIQHLNGLIKLTSGKITVDGIELHNKPDLKKLRAEVGMVFQYPEYQLFDETVEKDVSFGPKNLGLKKDEIAERVKEAVETVGLDYEQFKERSPFELSGGQKQRISIARLFLKNPPILILDEATSALDNESERMVQKSLDRLAEGRTTLTIAHRLTTIKNAERILVLTENGIAEDGNHKELMERGGIYANLYRTYEN